MSTIGSKKKPRKRVRKKKKSYKLSLRLSLLIAILALVALSPKLAAQPIKCGSNCVTLADAEKAISETEAIWEKALDESVKEAVIPLEVRITELEISVDSWRTIAETEKARAEDLVLQRNISLIGVGVFVVLSVIFGVT